MDVDNLPTDQRSKALMLYRNKDYGRLRTLLQRYKVIKCGSCQKDSDLKMWMNYIIENNIWNG